MDAPAGYHDHLNQDLLARMDPSASRVLEIGCGSGALARAYRARNPAAHYTGVELAEAAAKRAMEACDQVLKGDIESPHCLQALDRVRVEPGWDMLVCGDVLEHLRDPLRVLAELRLRCRPHASCVACIPNIGHVSIVRQLLAARFDYADRGLLDRTHLRFFTQPTMVMLFQQAGWTVKECAGLVFDEAETERAMAPLLALAPELGQDQARMRLHLSAYQWIVRAENPG